MNILIIINYLLGIVLLPIILLIVVLRVIGAVLSGVNIEISIDTSRMVYRKED